MNEKLEVEKNDVQENLNKNYNAEVIEKKHHTFANFLIILLILVAGGGLAAVIYLDIDPIEMLGWKKQESAIVNAKEEGHDEVTTTTAAIDIAEKPNIELKDDQTKAEKTLLYNGKNCFFTAVETHDDIGNGVYTELYINDKYFLKFDGAYKSSIENGIKVVKGLDKKDYLFINLPASNSGIDIEKPIIVDENFHLLYSFLEFNFNGQSSFSPEVNPDVTNVIVNENSITYYAPLTSIQKTSYSYKTYAQEKELTISNNKVNIITKGVVKGVFTGQGFDNE